MTSAGIAHTAARAIALLALLSPLWLADHATAQRRDFVGRVVSIDAQFSSRVRASRIWH